MSWVLTGDVESYARRVEPLLARAAVEHTLALTVIQNARARATSPSGALYGWWADPAGETAGAVSWTPPYGLLLSEAPEPALPDLVEAVLGLEHRPAAVAGPTGPALGFAALWGARTGEPAVVGQVHRLYRLADLVPPDPPPPGRPRAAERADAGLLAEWLQAFHREAEEASEPPNPVEVVRDRLSFGGLTLWEDGSGRPVAFAGRNRPAHGVIRVGPVYTATAERRRGWGGAVTAAVTRAALEAGAEDVVLHADVANPGSNRVYLRLGYRPVALRVVLRLGAELAVGRAAAGRS